MWRSLAIWWRKHVSPSSRAIAPDEIKHPSSDLGSLPGHSKELLARRVGRGSICLNPPNFNLRKETDCSSEFCVAGLDVMSFVDLIPDPSCVIDSAGNILYSNLKFRQSIRVQIQHSNRFSILSAVLPQDRDRLCEALTLVGRNLDHEFVQTSCRTFTKDSHENISEESSAWIFSSSTRLNLVHVTVRIRDRSLPRQVSTLAEPLQRGHSEELHPMSAVEDTPPDHSGITNEIANGRVLMKARKRLSKEAIDELLHSLKTQAAKDSFAEKRNLIRKVSHLMRSPLNAALTGLMIVEEDLSIADTAKALESIKAIKFSCENAIDILDDYVIYEKFCSKGGAKLDQSVINITNLVSAVVESFQLQASYSNVRLNLEHSAMQSSNSFVKCDARMLSHALRNILANSLKYTPEGGEVSVKVSYHIGMKKVRLEFSDSGPGLTASAKQKLFKEHKEDLQAQQGSGLGLYISKRVVKLHDGSIGTIDPPSGRGCVFFVDLPLFLGNFSIDSSEVVSPILKSSTSNDGTRPRLLVVDDDPLCRKMHCRLFSSYCDGITEASNGKDALSIIQFSMAIGKPFDCVLMDSSMPIMTGPDSATKMKEVGFRGKIFGVTGNVLQSDIEEFVNHGADEVFAKPLVASQVQQIVSKILL